MPKSLDLIMGICLGSALLCHYVSCAKSAHPYSRLMGERIYAHFPHRQGNLTPDDEDVLLCFGTSDSGADAAVTFFSR